MFLPSGSFGKSLRMGLSILGLEFLKLGEFWGIFRLGVLSLLSLPLVGLRGLEEVSKVSPLCRRVSRYSLFTPGMRL